MTTDDALKEFGSQAALAAKLGIKQPSVCNWGEYPPLVQQLRIQRLTKNKLKAETPEAHFERISSLRAQQAA